MFSRLFGRKSLEEEMREDEQFQQQRKQRVIEARTRWEAGHEVISGHMRNETEKAELVERIIKVVRQHWKHCRYYKIGLTNDGLRREQSYLGEGWEQLVPLYRTNSRESAGEMERLLIEACNKQLFDGFLSLKRRVIMNVAPGNNGGRGSGEQIVYIATCNNDRRPEKTGVRRGLLQYEKD